jgi:copper chaperone CopZ
MAVEYILVLDVAGAADVRAISAALGVLPGVRLVTVSTNDKRVRVEHDGRVKVEELIQTLNDAGYRQVALLV